MSYSKTSYSVGDIIKVAGLGPGTEKGIIIFMGENFLTYRGPYYNKTISAFEITSGKVTITVTDHTDDIEAAIEEFVQENAQETLSSGWLSPSIFAAPLANDDEEPEEESEEDDE